MDFDVATYLSPAAVAAVLGLTAVARYFLTRGGRPSPSWFVLVPIAIGVVVGAIHEVATGALIGLPKTVAVARVLETAIGYSGAAVLANQLYRRFIVAEDPEK